MLFSLVCRTEHLSRIVLPCYTYIHTVGAKVIQPRKLTKSSISVRCQTVIACFRHQHTFPTNHNQTKVTTQPRNSTVTNKEDGAVGKDTELVDQTSTGSTVTVVPPQYSRTNSSMEYVVTTLDHILQWSRKVKRVHKIL